MHELSLPGLGPMLNIFVQPQDLMRQIQDSSQRLLQAMDWPATTGASGRHSPSPPEGPLTRSREPKQPLEVSQQGFSHYH